MEYKVAGISQRLDKSNNFIDTPTFENVAKLFPKISAYELNEKTLSDYHREFNRLIKLAVQTKHDQILGFDGEYELIIQHDGICRLVQSVPGGNYYYYVRCMHCDRNCSYKVNGDKCKRFHDLCDKCQFEPNDETKVNKDFSVLRSPFNLYYDKVYLNVQSISTFHIMRRFLIEIKDGLILNNLLENEEKLSLLCIVSRDASEYFENLLLELTRSSLDIEEEFKDIVRRQLNEFIERFTGTVRD